MTIAMSHRITTALPESQLRGEPAIQLWSFLDEADPRRVEELREAIRAMAPRPGSLLSVVCRRLEFRLEGFQPVLFTAIDVCTHLQLAQLYFMGTSASAVDFLEFVIERFPFDVCEIRTDEDPFFTNPLVHQRQHRFTLAARNRSIIHSILATPEKDPLIGPLSGYLFAEPGDLHENLSPQQLMTSLLNFLYFHNNHRSLVTLGGKTPLQMLQSFPDFSSSSSFDPLTAQIPATSSFLSSGIRR